MSKKKEKQKTTKKTKNKTQGANPKSRDTSHGLVVGFGSSSLPLVFRLRITHFSATTSATFLDLGLAHLAPLPLLLADCCSFSGVVQFFGSGCLIPSVPLLSGCCHFWYHCPRLRLRAPCSFSCAAAVDCRFRCCRLSLRAHTPSLFTAVVLRVLGSFLALLFPVLSCPVSFSF